MGTARSSGHSVGAISIDVEVQDMLPVPSTNCRDESRRSDTSESKHTSRAECKREPAESLDLSEGNKENVPPSKPERKRALSLPNALAEAPKSKRARPGNRPNIFSPRKPGRKRARSLEQIGRPPLAPKRKKQRVSRAFKEL